MPLPPPPPPGPPPPPSLPTSFPQPSSKGKSGADNRNQLLTDIRAGTKLKKAVTNDRSAPLIEGKSKPPSSGTGVINGGPPNLAGLFAGGKPMLKPTLTNRGLVPMQPPSRRFPDDSPPSPVPTSQSYPSSPKAYSKHGIPEGYGTMRHFPKDVKGMAPLPPPANQKPVLGSSSMGAADVSRIRPGPPLPTKPPNVPNCKPNCPPVPRGPPPNKPPPPPKVLPARSGPPLPNKPRRRPQSIGEFDVKQNNGANHRPVVHIKVAPSSPTSTDGHSPIVSSPDIMKSVKNASTPNLLQLSFSIRDPPSKDPSRPPQPPNRTTPYMTRSSPSKPPPPPPQRPLPSSVPAPQSQMVNVAQPVPPPLPPHKMPPPPMPPQQPKLQMHNPPSSAPPPPPIRNSSTRNGDDFESRWYSRFVSINDLPLPDPFTNCSKSYPSKIAAANRREHAPPVPTDSFRVSSGTMPVNTQLQLGNKLWAKTSSEC